MVITGLLLAVTAKLSHAQSRMTLEIRLGRNVQEEITVPFLCINTL